MLEFYPDLSRDSVNVSLTLNTLYQKLPFNAVYCGWYNAGDKYFTQRDSLDNYLLLVTTSGRGEMSWRGKSCVLKAGDALLIDCNIFHEYRTLKDNRWQFYFVHFNAVSISGYANALLKTLTPVTLSSPNRVYNMLEQMCSVSGNASAKEYFVISNIISGILTEMVCSLSDSVDNIVDAGRNDIDELRKYIESNCADELDIDSFMKRTNLSRHYLIHIFKDQVGISPCQYMHMCRINRSQKLLVSTDMSLEQIADAVGYSGAAVFIRHFKRFIKITPDKYRREFHCR